MKTKRFMAFAIAVLTLTMAFAPAALAATAPLSWSKWPLQKMNSYDTMFTKAIQMYCNRFAGSSLSIDGVYGANTYNAVIEMQKRLGFTASSRDGKVGEATWTSMRSNLYLYSDNANVKAYKICLHSGGYDSYVTYNWNKAILNWYTATNITNSGTITFEPIIY